MQNFLKNLKRRYLLSQDEKVTFTFGEVKGLPVVTVVEYGRFRRKEATYLLTPTRSDRIAMFHSANGPVTIGITNDGEEIYVTPQGIFLKDYNVVTKQINEEAKSFIPEDKESEGITI